MSALAVVGVALILGWAGLWWFLGQHVRREAELEKRLDALEAGAPEG